MKQANIKKSKLIKKALVLNNSQMLDKLRNFFAEKPQKIEVFTTKGRRSYQQDNYFISEEVRSAQMCFVADGVGGHAHGEYASAKAVEVFKAEFENSEWKSDDIRNFLERTSRLAAAKIYNKSVSDKEYRGTGSTISGFFLQNNQFYTFNIGDSRIYQYSEKEKNLKQLTKDHSYINKLIAEGLLSKVEAKLHKKRNMVSSSLGMKLSDLTIDINGPYEIEKKDIILAVTDGLTASLSNEKIQNFISEHKNKKLAQLLVEQAFELGSNDNITVIVYRQQ